MLTNLKIVFIILVYNMLQIFYTLTRAVLFKHGSFSLFIDGLLKVKYHDIV